MRSYWKGLIVKKPSNGEYELKVVGLWDYIKNRFLTRSEPKEGIEKDKIEAMKFLIKHSAPKISSFREGSRCLLLIRNIAKQLGIEPQEHIDMMLKKIKQSAIEEETKIGKNLAAFYSGSQSIHIYNQNNTKNLFISDLWGWSDTQKEHSDDCFQWLFPVNIVSKTGKAPLLTSVLLGTMKNDLKILKNLKISFESILKFYGFQINDERKISQAKNLNERLKEWTRPNKAGEINPNYHRITRILLCLKTFGMKDEAKEFYCALENVLKEKGKINRPLLFGWQDIVFKY